MKIEAFANDYKAFLVDMALITFAIITFPIVWLILKEDGYFDKDNINI